MKADNYSQGQPWSAPTASGKVSGRVSLPGSKSLTNRELVLSALASGPSILLQPLQSRDSSLMIAALRSLGTEISIEEDGSIAVIPSELLGPARIDCGLAGTVMRFVPPLAALASGEVTFDGDEAAIRRPMATTIESLRALGVDVVSLAENPSGLPFVVRGSATVLGGHLVIDASKSSQFVSGLLLAAPRFEHGLALEHQGAELPSQPHIEMTLHCLANRGVTVQAVEESRWQVAPGEIKGMSIEIEPDLSNAGPFLAAALVTGGSVHIAHWPRQTTQVGREYIPIFEAMGAKTKLDETGLTVEGSGEINGIDLDLSIGGELAPTIAALAALANGPSRLRGIGHLRGHETDRLKALCTEINGLGAGSKNLPMASKSRRARCTGVTGAATKTTGWLPPGQSSGSGYQECW